MARTANVESETAEKGPVTKIVVDMSLSMAAALEAFATLNNATKVSVTRKALAGFIGYDGELVEFVDRSTAAKAAGAKRKVKSEAVKKQASLLEQLIAKLASGADLEEIKALIAS